MRLSAQRKNRGVRCPSQTNRFPVGIELGSTRTVVVQPHGSVLKTHTALTCLATYEDVLTGTEQVIYGEAAAREYPERVQFMLRSGVPEDADHTETATTFLTHFLREHTVPADSVVVSAVPTINNERGLANLARVIENSPIGERRLRRYPESLCGAIPAIGTGLNAIERRFIAINLGATTLSAGAYRRGEHLTRVTTGAVTGTAVDRWIAANVEDETQGRMTIDLTTAREYKEAHGDFEDFVPFTVRLQQSGGDTHEFTIERSVMDALDRYVDEAIETIANTFLPQLANDHLKLYKQTLAEPVVLTGGMACIPGLLNVFEARLSETLQHDVTVTAPDQPVTAAARGAQRIAAHFIETDAY
jgi:actin-like ATPase involved in cell morphogenesis